MRRRRFRRWRGSGRGYWRNWSFGYRRRFRRDRFFDLRLNFAHRGSWRGNRRGDNGGRSFGYFFDLGFGRRRLFLFLLAAARFGFGHFNMRRGFDGGAAATKLAAAEPFAHRLGQSER
jgi:hypothetical protein